MACHFVKEQILRAELCLGLSLTIMSGFLASRKVTCHKWAVNIRNVFHLAPSDSLTAVRRGRTCYRAYR